jgi:hypothetical protein
MADIVTRWKIVSCRITALGDRSSSANGVFACNISTSPPLVFIDEKVEHPPSALHRHFACS